MILHEIFIRNPFSLGNSANDIYLLIEFNENSISVRCGRREGEGHDKVIWRQLCPTHTHIIITICGWAPLAELAKWNMNKLTARYINAFSSCDRVYGEIIIIFRWKCAVPGSENRQVNQAIRYESYDKLLHSPYNVDSYRGVIKLPRSE